MGGGGEETAQPRSFSSVTCMQVPTTPHHRPALYLSQHHHTRQHSLSSSTAILHQRRDQTYYSGRHQVALRHKITAQDGCTAYLLVAHTTAHTEHAQSYTTLGAPHKRQHPEVVLVSLEIQHLSKHNHTHILPPLSFGHHYKGIGQHMASDCCCGRTGTHNVKTWPQTAAVDSQALTTYKLLLLWTTAAGTGLPKKF